MELCEPEQKTQPIHFILFRAWLTGVLPGLIFYYIGQSLATVHGGAPVSLFVVSGECYLRSPFFFLAHLCEATL